MNVNLVIPVLNQMKCLQECLESIAKNLTDSVHLFVHIIDNASTEKMIDVGAILKPKKIDYTIERNEINLGVCIPCNNGFKLALDSNADVFCVSNSDVVYGPMVIERCAEEAIKNGLSWPRSIRGGPKPIDFDVRAENARTSECKSTPSNGFIGWCFFLSREFMEKVGPFDEQFKLWYGEADYNYRLIQAGYKPVEVVDVLIHHYESKTMATMTGGFHHNGWIDQDAKNFQKKWANWGK